MGTNSLCSFLRRLSGNWRETVRYAWPQKYFHDRRRVIPVHLTGRRAFRQFYFANCFQGAARFGSSHGNAFRLINYYKHIYRTGRKKPVDKHFSSFAAIGSGCGLALGGIVATYLGWQWIFFINVPVITAALTLAYRYIDKDVVDKKQQFPDIISSVLLTLVIVLVSYVVHYLADFPKNYFCCLHAWQRSHQPGLFLNVANAHANNR